MTGLLHTHRKIIDIEFSTLGLLDAAWLSLGTPPKSWLNPEQTIIIQQMKAIYFKIPFLWGK